MSGRIDSNHASPSAFIAVRHSRGLSANRVKAGNTLGALRATGGQLAGLKTRSSGLVRPDSGRRNTSLFDLLRPDSSRRTSLFDLLRPDSGRRTSLFDLPRSGQALVSRLRGQVLPSSPLKALSGDGDGGALSLLSARIRRDSDGSGRLFGRTGGSVLSAPSERRGLGLLSTGSDEGGALSSLRRANALHSSLRSSFKRIDNSSRLLLSLGNPNRPNGGFGLASITRLTLNLIA